MKKNRKKLTLHRETLRRLEEKALAPAVGGTDTNTVCGDTACNCSQTNCTAVCIQGNGCGGTGYTC